MTKSGSFWTQTPGTGTAQEAIVEPDAHSVSEVRLSYEELVRIERAARTEGLTVNAFLRHAALERAMQRVPN
jgi:hypothetical protein